MTILPVKYKGSEFDSNDKGNILIKREECISVYMCSSKEWSLGLRGTGGDGSISGEGASSEVRVERGLTTCALGRLGEEETEDRGVPGARDDVEVRAVVNVEIVEIESGLE